MPVMHLIHVTTEMIKSLQYIFSNKGLISYIKTPSRIKNNPQAMMMYSYNKDIRHIIVCFLP